MSILEVKNLTHTYGGNTPFINDAVRDVSFSVDEGEIVGIIGHTGSGKSTLVQHLNGLLKPTNGEIFIEEQNIWEKPKEIRKVRSKVGLVFQYPEYQLFEETVYADIGFGPKNMGLSGEELDKRIRETCKIIGVKDEFLEKSPFDLSGGEKRRVAIAGVLAMNPKIIVFDEPTAGLDPKGREDIIDVIYKYREATNATVIIISHNMEDMAQITDKLLVMNKGALAMCDKTENIFKQGDALREMGLNSPIVTRVFDQLKKQGIDLPDDVFTVERAVEVLKNIKAGVHNA
ncbi:MAG: energy-coupling factor transporter ATPase [Clostridia bacterium]|nr:energy-coupling factor transporter ATPase [Clostridia bacterium]MBR6564997.1 energy-coupling factor transporter ATPase [Clostridia bacterium]MBR6741547.1 energy-coupling factor transporter ATPase [Clostridia bacterium]